jgi:hypothetical protein
MRHLHYVLGAVCKLNGLDEVHTHIHTYTQTQPSTNRFECAACTASWELYAKLNGLDEVLDVGDDAQEANVKDRAVVSAELEKKVGLHAYV